METFFYTKSRFKEIYNDIEIIDFFFKFTPKTKSELKQAIDFYYNNRQEGIAKYGIMNEWNTILITDMSALFSNMTEFNEPIGNWDTSNVTDMSCMFYSDFDVTNITYIFNQPIGNWNTSNVTNMSGMFIGASNFNQPIGNWDTSNVTNMSEMFCNASDFNQPIENWNTRTN